MERDGTNAALLEISWPPMPERFDPHDRKQVESSWHFIILFVLIIAGHWLVSIFFAVRRRLFSYQGSELPGTAFGLSKACLHVHGWHRPSKLFVCCGTQVLHGTVCTFVLFASAHQTNLSHVNFLKLCCQRQFR